MTKILILLTCIFSSGVSAQTGKAERLRQLENDVTTAVSKDRLGDAIKAASEALVITQEISGEQSVATAQAYNMLGALYRDKGNIKKSIALFTKGVDIYESLPKGEGLVRSYGLLANSQRLSGHYDDSREAYKKAIEVAETTFGYHSKQVFPPVLNMANLLALVEDFEEADRYYIRSYVIAHQTFGARSPELSLINENRTCLVSLKRPGFNELKAFHDELSKVLPSYIPPSGIISGRVISLVKPTYPREYKDRPTGAVAIRIEIGETGEVQSAETMCGDYRFAKEAKAAALRSRFMPTVTPEGAAMTVAGTIVYNFVP